MKKRFFGVLLALAALGLIAGSAMASETIKFTLTATVDGESALSEEFSFDPSKIALISSTDVGTDYSTAVTISDKGKTYIEELLGDDYGTLSKDILTATGKVTVSSKSAKVKFAVSDKNDGEVLDANSAKVTMGFYENDDGDPKAVAVKAASGIDGFDSATTVYVPVSVKTVEDPTASTKKYVEYGEGKSVVYVAVKVTFQAIIEGESIDLPKTYNGRAATQRLFARITKTSQKKALAKKILGDEDQYLSVEPSDLNLLLNKSVANKLGYAVDDADIDGQATATQAKKVAASGVDGVEAVMPEGKFANSNTSAYVFSAYELSDATKADIADASASLYFLDLTRTHAGASISEYGKAEEAQDAIYLIYDADEAEFREPDEDDEYDFLFIAFTRDPGTFQPFLATGVATDPSKPTEVTPTPEAEITPTPEAEITPTPEAEITPTPTSGPKKSSGSSGCDMGMVGGLAILLAALLPLRKVRK